MEALLRMIPALVKVDTEFKHREELSDLGFLRERLGALRPGMADPVEWTDRQELPRT